MILRGDSEMSQKDKEIIIIVPIYKNNLDPFEMTSLDYCKQYLKKYYMIVISPQSLYNDEIFLDFIKKEKINVHYFEDKFFDGLDGYNSLMLNLDFYKTFSDYRYMLIYQLDALVFSDDLLKWTKKDYDYIGAPWLASEDGASFDSLGNGGLSLRKINTFITVLESRDLFYSQSKYYNTSYRARIKYMLIIRIFKKLIKYNFSLNYLKLFLYLYKENEDYFWAFYAKFFTKIFVLPTVEESLKFSFEVNPSLSFNYNKNVLPFGAHAWHKYDLNFWLKNIDGLDEKLAKYEKFVSKRDIKIYKDVV